MELKRKFRSLYLAYRQVQLQLYCHVCTAPRLPPELCCPHLCLMWPSAVVLSLATLVDLVEGSITCAIHASQYHK